MIVNAVEEGWEVIHQRAHGLLAAKLAHAWPSDGDPQRRLELLVAVADHDDNQRPFRARDHLTERGAPRGFDLRGRESDVTSLEQPRATLDDARRRGRYAGLLTAMHLAALYGPRRGEDASLDAFLDELTARTRAWRRALGLTKTGAERDYAVVRWCDRLSLILCERAEPQGGRRIEVEPLPDGAASWLWRRDDGTLALDPWPFAGDEVEVTVDVLRLARLAYDDDAALAEALDEAPVEARRWTFRRG